MKTFKDLRSENMYLAIVIGLGSFSDGFALLLQSGALLSLVPYFRLNSLFTGLVVSAPFIGSVLGAIIFGWLADKIGRRAIVLNVLLFFVLSSIMSSISVNIQMLLLSRFLVGIGIGGDIPASGSLIAERSEPSERGAFLSTQTLLWAVGAAIATVVSLPLLSLGKEAWRVLFGLAAIPPVFTLLLRRRIKESFRWVKNKTTGNASNRLTRRAVYLTAILSIGLFVWTMILAVFASYLPSLLTRIYGLPPYESLIIGSIQWVMYILGCVVAFKLVDVIGRKRLIVIGTLVAMVSAVLVYLSGRNIISVITAGVLAIWGAGGTAYTGISIYSFEIPPTLYRGLLSGAVFGSGRLGGYSGTLIFPTLIGVIGIVKAFGLMGLVMLLVTVAFGTFNQKTERIDLEMIESSLTKA